MNFITTPPTGAGRIIAAEAGTDRGWVLWEPHLGHVPLFLAAVACGPPVPPFPDPSILVTLGDWTDAALVTVPIPGPVWASPSAAWTRDEVFRTWNRLRAIGAYAAMLACLLNWGVGSAHGCAAAAAIWERTTGLPVGGGQVVSLAAARAQREDGR
jgi:hypothetical protein